MFISQSVIATLATGPAIKDLRVLLKSLSIFNTNPPIVYLYCDTEIANVLHTVEYEGILIHKICLDSYTKFSRFEMEQKPGTRFNSLWFDFMTEKINLLRWVFAIEPKAAKAGVMFCDADICFMGPLPEVPVGAVVALSPHNIRPEDELKYGKYNGGFLWMSRAHVAEMWWKYCLAARFYEQSALEDVANNLRLENSEFVYEFPNTDNYGWWRLWQGVENPGTLMNMWGINRKQAGAGITVNGRPLGSVHTHFYEKKDGAVMSFNTFVIQHLKKLVPYHFPAQRLFAALQ